MEQNSKTKLSKEEKLTKKAEIKKAREEKKQEKNKNKKPNKFIETIKQKWLINGTKTAVLVIALVLLFIVLNLVMQKLEITPLDFTQEKLYTLTEESKEKVKNIDKDVNIYFIGYSDSDPNF